MKIICIGRNYAEHAAELHEQLNDSGKLPEEPMFFLKPDTALLRNNDPFYIPSFSQEVHYECELVVRINRVGKAIAERFAHRYYDEVGLGIDFTARDLQRRAIAEGLPWESCKAFDRSAAISPEFVSLQELGGDVQRLHFTLDVNGERRQRGDTVTAFLRGQVRHFVHCLADLLEISVKAAGYVKHWCLLRLDFDDS